MRKVGILGHGVVGGGVARVLIENADVIREQVGEPLEIGRILDLRTFSNLPYADAFTTNPDDVIRNPDIAIVAECMGGLHPAYEYVKTALENGKQVVTSNKELIAVCGAELTALAEAKGVNLFYEASVGGGIPVIRPMTVCLAANRIESILGIVNGTTNYILTRMESVGLSFSAALAEAQAEGYAESDPTADIEGIDTRRKLAILSHIAFQAPFNDSIIQTQGISNIQLEDLMYAKSMGCAVKLLGMAQSDGKTYRARVAPALLPKSHPLSTVRDVFNAVMISGNAVGDVMFYGRGAGSMPTASAVAADIIQAAIRADSPVKEPKRAEPAWREDDEKFSFFFRVRFAKRQRAVDRVAEELPGAQLIWMDGEAYADEFGVRTEPMREADVARARQRLAESGLSPTIPIRFLP